MSDQIPAWAHAYDHPCVTAKCTDCGGPYGDPDIGGAWHFESAEEIREIVARDREDEGDDAAWRLVDGALLCLSCVASRKCAIEGHAWKHYPASVSYYDGHKIPEMWSCPRGCNTPATRTNPKGTT